MHSVVKPENLTYILNIGLDKANQILRVTTQRVICMEVHPIRRKYITYHLDRHLKYISGRWYVYWMPAATKSITQCKGAFVYYNGTLTAFYLKESYKSMKAADLLKELCKGVYIPYILKSDRAP